MAGVSAFLVGGESFGLQQSCRSDARGVWRGSRLPEQATITRFSYGWLAAVLLGLLVTVVCPALHAQSTPDSIRFAPVKLPFHLETNETPTRHVPSTMAGGVAVLDYNRDGRPDIFFTNGANLQTLQKDDPKYRNRLLRNDGEGKFTDVTAKAGLAGTGFDNGVAVADFDNDGYPDLFVTGLHHNTLYHNNRDGTFTDVTAKAGLDHPDPQYGPLWSVAAVWVDVNNDGLLDLFVVNYLQWDYATEHICQYRGVSDYCAPSFYKGEPNQLFLNQRRRLVPGRFSRMGHPFPRWQGHGRCDGRLQPGRQA